jgi:hypothetical protein
MESGQREVIGAPGKRAGVKAAAGEPGQLGGQGRQ